MKNTATDNNGYKVDFTLTKKEWASKEDFLNSMVNLIVLICDQIALKTGNDDLSERKPLVSQILNVAAESTESILDMEYGHSDTCIFIEGSQLIAFMEKIYRDRIRVCKKQLGKKKVKDIFRMMRKDAEYSLGYEEDCSCYHLYLWDGGELKIPIGAVEKNESDETTRKETGQAFIFASRLMEKAFGNERSTEILKKYRSIEFLYEQIREHENS